MSDTPTNDMQPNDMDEFIASLEAFKSVDDSETIQEQQDVPATEAPAQVAVTTPIDPAILEVQRNQIEVSQRLADLLEQSAAKTQHPKSLLDRYLRCRLKTCRRKNSRHMLIQRLQSARLRTSL